MYFIPLKRGAPSPGIPCLTVMGDVAPEHRGPSPLQYTPGGESPATGPEEVGGIFSG